MSDDRKIWPPFAALWAAAEQAIKTGRYVLLNSAVLAPSTGRVIATFFSAPGRAEAVAELVRECVLSGATHGDSERPPLPRPLQFSPEAAKTILCSNHT